MITLAIVTRRLKEGETYEDFRKAWYHTVGFGTPSKLYTMISAFDAQEITVIGFVETDLGEFRSKAEIDVKQRLDNPLDDVIEPQVSRHFGVLVSEDDFSASGSIEYKRASIAGKVTNLEEFAKQLQEVSWVVTEACRERDSTNRATKGS
jgi:hypothetical protein